LTKYIPGDPFIYTTLFTPPAAALSGNYTVHVEVLSMLMDSIPEDGSASRFLKNRNHENKQNSPKPPPLPVCPPMHLACYDTTLEIV
jgi:hypothetical protein